MLKHHHEAIVLLIGRIQKVFIASALLLLLLNPVLKASAEGVEGQVFGEVFLDLDNNQTQDSYDDLLPGVSVDLFFAESNTLVASVLTNQMGEYVFPDVPSGNYYAKFHHLEGYNFCTQNSSDADGSDANPFTGMTDPFWIDNSNLLVELNAGMDMPPNGVFVAGFSGEAIAPNRNLLTWETGIELEALGFNLYRSETLEGDVVQVNDEVIPPHFPGSTMGSLYEYEDQFSTSGPAYYWLESLQLTGLERHGPVLVDSDSIKNNQKTIFLTFISTH